MRIVGGRFRGRSLKGPTNQAIRPTSDRLRETLFNILEHACGDPVRDARIIDVFAGTGALALEALSRGAQFALLVDDGSQAQALIRSNIETLDLASQTRILKRSACKIGAAPPGESFALAFLDPPYNCNLATAALIALRDGAWLADGALLVVEEAVKARFEIPAGYKLTDTRVFGDTQLVFLRFGG